MLKLVFRRIKNRIKYAFTRWYILFNWQYESCADCGKCYNLSWGVKDEPWHTVMGDKENKTICLDCFSERCVMKEISVSKNDITWLALFMPLRTNSIEDNLTLAEIFEAIDFINTPLFKKGKHARKFGAPQVRRVGFSEE